MKKLFSFLLSLRKEFLRYFTVGVSGVFLDIFILYVFKKISGASATWGVVVSQSVVLIYNFLLNKYWSFQSRQSGKNQFLKYLSVVALNYVLGVTAMYLFHDVWGFYYLGVRLASIAAIVPLNFFLYKYWIYKTPQTGISPS